MSAIDDCIIHVHEGNVWGVRTTVELTAEQRAKLLSMAASRGEKGFSAIVREAIDLYLAQQSQRSASIAAAKGLVGFLDEAEGLAMEERCRGLRESWR